MLPFVTLILLEQDVIVFYFVLHLLVQKVDPPLEIPPHFLYLLLRPLSNQFLLLPLPLPLLHSLTHLQHLSSQFYTVSR